MFSLVAVADTLQQAQDLVELSRLQKRGDRLVEHFARRIAVDALSGCIPGLDDAIQRHADDGIVGGLNDCGQKTVRGLCLAAFNKAPNALGNFIDEAALFRQKRAFIQRRMRQKVSDCENAHLFALDHDRAGLLPRRLLEIRRSVNLSLNQQPCTGVIHILPAQRQQRHQLDKVVVSHRAPLIG